MYRKLFLSGTSIFVLLSLSLVVSVDADTVMWDEAYGGIELDSAQSLVESSDGGYAIAGDTQSFGAGSYDVWFIKTDEFGNMEWNKTYGGTENDRAYSLVETSNGGYALAGFTGSFGAGESDFWLIKTDEFGNMEWNKTYGGTGGDFAYSLVETSGGGYAIAGWTDSFGAGESDFWLVKTDASGNMEWDQTYGGTDWDLAQSLVATSDGGYALAGSTFSSGAGNDDFWLVKTDASGNMEWDQTYGGTSFDSNPSLVNTSDGGYALAGSTESFGAGGYDFWLVKTDASGNMEWDQTYGGKDWDVPHSLVATSDGGYGIAGYTSSFGAGSRDFRLVKTDEFGVITEYSSWLLPLLLLTVTMVVIIYKKKLLKPRS